MSAIVPGDHGERQQDFRLLIGPEPFDPKDAAPRPRRPPATAVRTERSGDAGAARSGDAGTEPPVRAGGARTATLVQFSAALTQSDAERLRAAYGLALDRYVPNLAYLERLSAETVARLRADFLVRACVALDPALKLAPWIGGTDDQPAPSGPLELIATLFDDADVAGVQSALGAIGARDVQVVDDRPIAGRVHLRFALDDSASVARIAEIDDLVWVEPVPVIVSANAEAVQVMQSGRTGTGSTPIWDHGLHGEGQVIGVTDDQVLDIDHCFFADAAPNKPGTSHRKVLQIINPRDQGPSPHHTFVAGIAAGDDRNQPGAHQHRAGAWAAKLVCINRFMMDDPGFLWTYLQVLNRETDFGAVVHNASWGVRSPNYTKIARDADAFSWDNEEHVVVAAGENSTPPLGYNSPPGTAKNTLCVAAAKAFPNQMEIGSGTPGPTVSDNRRKPDLVAVGCGIVSAKSGSKCDTDLYEKFVTNAQPCATSWAAPQVAAAAALVRQYFVEGWYPTGKKDPQFGFTPSGALIRAVLLNATVDMTGVRGYPSNAEGWGLIQLDRALYFDGRPRKLAVRDMRRKHGLGSGEQNVYFLQISNRAEQLKITLVWTDPPPSEHAYRNPSVNAMKLTVQDAAGVKYLGNDLDFNTGLSKPNGAGPQDRVNNVQMVIVNNPPVGMWLVQVGTDNVTSDQGYALVASGGLTLSALISPF